MHPGRTLRWIYYRSVENVQDKKVHWPRDNMDEAELIKMIPHVVRSSTKKVWIDYDEEGKITGLTIIAAKRFTEEAAA